MIKAISYIKRTKILNKTSLFILINILTLNMFSQNNEHYFYDSIQEGYGKISYSINEGEYFYIAHTMAGENYGNNSISKIDTNGVEIWNTFNINDHLPTNQSTIKRMILSDNYIYVLVEYRFVNDDSGGFHKIDKNTGRIVWSKIIEHGIYDDIYVHHIFDYDEDNILIGFEHDIDGTASKHKKLLFCDKDSGNVISSYTLLIHYPSSYPWNMNIDSDRNIYLTCMDTLFKFDATKPDSLLWKVYTKGEPNLNNVKQLYVDSNDNLFLFGSREGWGTDDGKVVHFDKETGNVIWNTTADTDTEDVLYSSMIERNGCFYITWVNANTGSGTCNTYITKVEKSSGNIIWHTKYDFIGNGNPGIPRNEEQGGLSIAMDEENNLYTTGYYGGSGCWGNLKLDESTGNVIYESTITIDTNQRDFYSQGKYVFIVNNTPYVIGNLHYDYTNESPFLDSKVVFAKLNALDGEVIELSNMEGFHQFSCRTVHIEKFGVDKTLIMKQEGRYTTLEMLDYNNNSLWKNKYLKNEHLDYSYLNAKDFKIMENGNILLECHLEIVEDYPPYHSYSNASYCEIVYFEIDSLGNLKDEWYYQPEYANYYPPIVSILDNNKVSYKLYHDKKAFPSRYRINKCLTDQTSITKDIAIDGTGKYNNSINLLDFSNTNLMFFGNYLNKGVIYTINKGSLDIQTTKELHWIKEINHVSLYKTNQVVLTGMDSNNKGFVALFSLSINDTIWTRKFVNDSFIYKVIYDTDKSALYCMGQANEYTTIHKMSIETSEINWSYKLDNIGDIGNIPSDLFYDKYRGNIVIYGQSQIESDGYKVPGIFVETLNKNGGHENSKLKVGKWGYNQVFSGSSLYNGSVLIGGNLNTKDGQAGFVFETEIPIYYKKRIEVETCTEYYSPSGIYTWTESGTFIDTLINYLGCDTIFTVELNINNNNSGIDEITACDSYTWIDGVTYTESNNIATYTLTNVFGCDSIVTLALTIRNSNSGIDEITACDSYTWIDGITYIENNNTAIHTLTNINGCDSVIRLNLTIFKVSNEVKQTNDTLIALENDATYNWFDCSENSSEFLDQTQSFKADMSGQYAVHIIKNGCETSSECFEVTIQSSKTDNLCTEFFKVYPNPTDGKVNLEFINEVPKVEILIRDITGQIIDKHEFFNSKNLEFEINGNSGIYILEVITDNLNKRSSNIRLIKN